MHTANPIRSQPPMQRTSYVPGLQLYNEIRAGLILKNTSLSVWCLAHGVKRQNARLALLGGWRGPKADRIVRQIIKAAGLKESA